MLPEKRKGMQFLIIITIWLISENFWKLIMIIKSILAITNVSEMMLKCCIIKNQELGC